MTAFLSPRNKRKLVFHPESSGRQIVDFAINTFILPIKYMCGFAIENSRVFWILFLYIVSPFHPTWPNVI